MFISNLRARLHGKWMILALGSSYKVHLAYMQKRSSCDQLLDYMQDLCSTRLRNKMAGSNDKSVVDN